MKKDGDVVSKQVIITPINTRDINEVMRKAMQVNFDEITPEQQMKERNGAYDFFRLQDTEMTPIQKADELVEKYNEELVSSACIYQYPPDGDYDFIKTKQAAKRCALIAVKEIIKSKSLFPLQKRYWKDVEQALERAD